MEPERKRKNEKIAHMLAAVIILLHGFESHEKGESGYLLFFISGSLFLLMVLFHKQLAARIKWADGVFHGIEAVVMFGIAYTYFHHGKTALPFAYIIAGAGYIIAAVLISGKGYRQTSVH